MRRVLILCTALAVLLVLAAAAPAAQPVRDRDASASANAFWYSTQQLSSTSYRLTTWYVGVYQSAAYGTFSDLYQEVIRCRTSPRGESCVTEAFRYGDHDLAGQTFTIDEEKLTSAHLDAVYDLQTYDSRWNPTGRPTPTRIVADWTGTGDLAKSKGKFTYRSGCTVFRYSFNGLSRSAVASGSVAGVDLGQTSDAWLATDSSTNFERVC